MIKVALAIITTLIVLPIQAQEVNRYLVYLTDKQNSPYVLSEPQQFLSDRAIDRRSRYSIPINTSDLPVSPYYLDILNKEEQVKTYYTSKWLNAVLIQETEERATRLLELEFVLAVEYLAPGARLNTEILSAEKVSSAPQNRTTIKNDLQNELLGANKMHADGYTGEGKLIAILDAGFPGVDTVRHYKHLRDANKILATKNFVENSANVYTLNAHGSWAFSTMAAYVAGEYEGTAYGASYALAITEDTVDEYIIEEYNYLFAAEWADSLGADIITASLGYRAYDDEQMSHALEDLDGKTTPAARAATFATNRGILVVNSAGNYGQNGISTIITPADAENILAVGAIGADLKIAGFSSLGPTGDSRLKPDVVALGNPAVIVMADGTYRSLTGTSFSAPIISGFAASLWQKIPDSTNLQIRQIILESSNNYLTPDNLYGYGLPSYERIVRVVLGSNNLIEGLSLYPNPANSGDLVRLMKTEGIEISIYSLNGAKTTAPYFTDLKNNQLVLNTSGMRSGVYLVSLKSTTSRQHLRLLIK